ncbi:MAG: hypothetical protein JO281_11855 [Pseudonocardiales bacterium]|nr:hypothetical protein [Pseudonocardiales bacterium]
MPGTFLGADRHWCGREGTSRLCPISDTCQNILVTDPEHAREIWSEYLYGVLLVCGHGGAPTRGGLLDCATPHPDGPLLAQRWWTS